MGKNSWNMASYEVFRVHSSLVNIHCNSLTIPSYGDDFPIESSTYSGMYLYVPHSFPIFSHDVPYMPICSVYFPIFTLYVPIFSPYVLRIFPSFHVGPWITWIHGSKKAPAGAAPALAREDLLKRQAGQGSMSTLALARHAWFTLW